MPKFDDYTQKTTPEDTDIALILDKTANVNKKTPFSGIWNWIVNKMTNAVIQNLQTTNKTVIGAINELNSKSTYLRDIPLINPELLSPGQTLLDYITNNFSSRPSIYFLVLSSTLTSEHKAPFPRSGAFVILYNASTAGFSLMYAFSYDTQIKTIRKQGGTWDSDWIELK